MLFPADREAVTAMRKTKGSLLLRLMFCSFLLPTAMIMGQAANSQEPDADTLVLPLEILPSQQATAATFVLDEREFVLCRGPGWEGEPPASNWFRLETPAGPVTNPGLWNNDRVAKLATIDSGDRATLQAIAADFDRGMRSDPHFPAFAFNAGRVYLMLARPDIAMRRLERARALVPRLALVHHYLARAYEAAGEDQAALASLREAARLDPADLRSLIALGDFFLDREQPTQAEAYYATALKLRPDYAFAKVGLARLQIRAGDFPRARVILESIETTELDGSDRRDYPRVVHLFLAQIAVQERDYATAVEQYDRLLQKPNDPFFIAHSRREIERRRAIVDSLARTARGE